MQIIELTSGVIIFAINIAIFTDLFLSIKNIIKLKKDLDCSSEDLLKDNIFENGRIPRYKVVIIAGIEGKQVLDVNFPKKCLICGSKDYQGVFKFQVGYSKNFIKIPLCELHYKMLKSIVRHKKKRDPLEFRPNFLEFCAPLILFFSIIIINSFFLAKIIPYSFIRTSLFSFVLFIAVHYIIKFPSKLAMFAIFSERIDLNLKVYYFKSNYLIFRAFSDTWFETLKDLNPNKHLKMKFTSKLTKNAYKQLFDIQLN